MIFDVFEVWNWVLKTMRISRGFSHVVENFENSCF